MHFTRRTFFIFAFVFFASISGAFPVEAETLSVSPSSVPSTGIFTVSWTALASHSMGDWVGIFAIGAPNTSYNNWTFVPSGTSGTLTLAALDAFGEALPPGNYEVRYLLSYYYIEPSPSVRVPITVSAIGTSASAATGTGTGTGAGTGTGTGIIAPPTLFLGAVPPVISAGQSATLSWSASNVTSCTAGSSDGTWAGSKSTAGSVNFANMMEGVHTYTLTCQGNNGTQISSDAQIFVGPAPIPVVFFSATPAVLAAGGNVTLSWSSANAVSCTGGGDAVWSGQNPKPTSGTITFTDVQTSTTYSILCTNSTGQSSPLQSVSVVVGPTLSFTASPASIDYGAKTLLAWTASSNIVSCTPSGFTAPMTLPTGSVLVLPTESTSYTLTCKTSDASVLPVSKSASVGVKPVLLKADVNPPFVSMAGSSIFTWEATPNAVSCDVSGDWSATGLPISGSKVFSDLTVTQRFTFSCMTADNLVVSQPVKINVGVVPVISSFTLDKTAIALGESVTATWVVKDATTCMISGLLGVAKPSLSVDFTNGAHTKTIPNVIESTTLTLLCGGGFGTASKQVSITVDNMPPPTPPPPDVAALTFTANKTTINSGESVTVTWTVKDATKCAAGGSGGWMGLVDRNDGTHTQIVPIITKDSTLSLTCYGVSDQVTKTILITINGGQSFLCTGIGKCKLSTQVCSGTQKTASDCTGGTLCCVPSGTPSSGQWVTSPTSNGTGLLLTLIGSTVLGAWQAVPSGSGWQMTQSDSQSFTPVLNSDGTLEIVPNADGTWQVFPSSGSTGTLSNVQFNSNGSGGWTIVPVAGTASGGSTGLGGGTSSAPPPIVSGTGVGPAETGGLVPCGTEIVSPVPGADYSVAEGCKFEHFIKLAKNVMNFLLFIIAVPIAAISFAWAGWLYLSAAGNESKVQEAHRIFGTVVLGLALALAAWLIVNAIVIGLGVGAKYNFLGTG